MNLSTIFFNIVISALIAYPAGGFVLGFIVAHKPISILGRVVIGIIIGFLSIFSGGFPPQNEGGVGEPYNAWPYIVAIFFITFVIRTWYTYEILKRI